MEMLQPIVKFLLKYGINFLLKWLADAVAEGLKGEEVKTAVNELGDLIKAAGDTIADGKYDDTEKTRIEKEVGELVDACFKF